MMGDYLSIWWMWICVALVVGLIELLAPGFIFLGFSLAALAMAAVVFVVPGMSVPVMLALYAVLALVAWIVLRQVFKRQSSGARIVTEDINDH